MLDADSDATVMGLVWAHLQSNPEALLAWVSPYTQVRYMGYSRGFSLVHVAGHYRQKTVLAPRTRLEPSVSLKGWSRPIGTASVRPGLGVGAGLTAASSLVQCAPNR